MRLPCAELALLVAAGACTPVAAAPLKLVPLERSAEKPANVRVLFSVESPDGSTPELAADRFDVREDGTPVPRKDLNLLNPDLRWSVRTVLLLDLGGHPAPDELGLMASAATSFFERLGTLGKVAVYSYDGEPVPHLWARAALTTAEAKAAIGGIVDYRPQDTSTDLHGALVAGVSALNLAVQRQSSGGARLGELIVIARSPDRAARSPVAEVKRALAGAQLDVRLHTIWLGAGAAEKQVAELAESSSEVAAPAELAPALARIGDAVERRGKSLYFLSYCSGARAGEHTLTIDFGGDRPRAEDAPPRLSYRFSAEGFGAGCDASIPLSLLRAEQAYDPE